ncbi:MAG: topoisomerase IV, partial [Clostridia bacterium]|nr:topoisomerase IV [Clostridia bacterium]
MPYAMSVIVSRAIPEIDGLKPSHRKLLYTMYKMGLLNGKTIKSANIAGQTMKLNPHGDAAIYETMVRLTEGHEALLHPLVESKGSFGKHYSDMAYAAPRYTEAKLAPICSEIFADIDKNTVDFIDNYDNTMKEPVLLPTKFPNILVNPNMGIAVGMASNICSFNLKEICATTIAFLKNEKCNIQKTLLAPDFSTGGEIIYDEEQMKAIYETGRGSFKIRSKYSYDKKNNCIDIFEIPYTTKSDIILAKIIELIKANKVKEISDIRDETDKNGLKITIDLKRGTDPEKLMQKLFKMTTLMDSFGCNFNILIGSTPKVMGIREILSEWSKFRIDCIKRQLAYDIGKKSDRLHLLEGLEKILLDIDKAIKIIRETDEDEMVVPNLMSGFGIDEIQAEFVAEIKLRNLNKEYILKRTQDIEDLIDEIARLRAIYGDEEQVKLVIIDQLKEISKKYGQERKTAIIGNDEIEEYHEEEIVENYNLRLFLTRDGYLKKISLVSLRTSGEQRLKEGDEIVLEKETENIAEIVVFTDKCNAYKAKLSDIPDGKASQLGEYLPTLLKMEPDEKVVGIAITRDYKGNMLFCFENGKMKKTPLEGYATKTNRKKLT